MPPKKTSLSEALANAANGPPKRARAEKVETPAGASPGSAKPYRVGRVNVTGYFDPAVKKSIRLIQAKHPDRTLQDLLAEALNDLFAKYNVPESARVSSRV